jgi:hypothetical protein
MGYTPMRRAKQEGRVTITGNRRLKADRPVSMGKYLSRSGNVETLTVFVHKVVHRRGIRWYPLVVRDLNVGDHVNGHYLLLCLSGGIGCPPDLEENAGTFLV